MEVMFEDGRTLKISSLSLDLEMSKDVFGRTEKINRIVVHIRESVLR
jgi:hypothetical protein